MPRLLTVADVVSAASIEIGIALRAPTTVIGSTDQDIAQMLALLTAVADELLMEEPYKITLGDGNWLQLNDSTLSDRPQSDTDLVLFDGRLATTGLKFKFLAAKGLEFGEVLRDFSTRLNKLAAKANRKVLILDQEEGVVQ